MRLCEIFLLLFKRITNRLLLVHMRCLYCFILLLFLPAFFVQAQLDPDLEQSINSMIRKQQYKYGNPIIQVGVIQADRSQLFLWGDEPKSTVPDSLLMFELGATTKIFSAIIMMGLAKDSIINIEGPISEFLPDSISNAKLDNITFSSLASHTSGMMRYPYNLRFSHWNQDNLYRDYTDEKLLEFLERYTFKQSEDSKKKKYCPYKYSDAGYGLLGYLMETASGKTYSELLDLYIKKPLKLKATDVITPTMQHLASPTDLKGEPASNWIFDSMEATAGLASNLYEMMVFAAAILNQEVPQYFSSTMQLISCTEMQYLKAGYGWHIFMANRKDPLVYTHAGNTGGYSSYIAINPSNKTAVVLLSNSNARVDQLGIDLLNLISGR